MEKEKGISMSKFKKIYVFHGSSQEKKKSYQDAAIDLAKELVLKNIDLVYGGGSLRLMGLISQALFDSGRHVLGYDFQITGVTVGEVKQVVDMHQRKAEMAKHSNAFIALPG
ncbi:putative LOG family protein [Dioscorea sansibarensis]